jgi:hypothetical protein
MLHRFAEFKIFTHIKISSQLHGLAQILRGAISLRLFVLFLDDLVSQHRRAVTRNSHDIYALFVMQRGKSIDQRIHSSMLLRSIDYYLYICLIDTKYFCIGSYYYVYFLQHTHQRLYTFV